MKTILLIILILHFISAAFYFALGIININNTNLLKFQGKNLYLFEVRIGTNVMRIKHWDMREEKLELYSSDNDGAQVILLYY